MLKSAGCSICLSINKRTINIYDTNLLHVYENLVNFKSRPRTHCDACQMVWTSARMCACEPCTYSQLADSERHSFVYGRTPSAFFYTSMITDVECWVCYICHTRLRQCHQLQQLAVQTRGLIDDIFHNKIDTKFGAYACLLELSPSRTKMISNLSNIKKESDRELGFYYYDSALQDQTGNTNETNIIIKQELNVKTELSSDDENEQDETLQNDHKEKPFNVSKETLSDVKDLSIEGNVNSENLNSLGLNMVKQSQCGVDSNVWQHAIKSDTEVCLKGWSEQICRVQELRNEEIKEIEVEIEQDIPEDKRSKTNCDKRDKQPSSSHRKPFRCDICLKNFSWESDLRYHSRQHTSEKPFECELCAKKFTRRSSLNIHLQIHAGVKSFTCDICSKKFSQKSHLNVHIQAHAGTKLYSCETCPKKFLQKSNLKSHMLTHTGKKPFGCDLCLKKYSRKSDLNVHKRTHIGYKPFSCDICTKKFAQKSHLKSHIRTHTV